MVTPYHVTFDHLEERLRPRLPGGQVARVRKAYELAETAHRGQVRDEGTPNIVHPVRVAISLVNELEIYSSDLVCAALLHDVIEDSPITREQIALGFGEQVATIVWLLTKSDDAPLGEYLAAIEAAADIGAPIVKLCDRLDNLRYVIHSPRVEKIRRYIRTTEVYYLPMAARTNAYLHDELRRCLEEVRSHLAASSL